MASHIDLHIEQGSDFSKIVTILTKTGSIFGLAGCTVTSTMISSSYSDKPVNFQIESYNPAAGQVVIAMTATDTWLLTFLEYQYDLTVKDSNGETTRVIEGTVFVKPGVTGKPLFVSSGSGSGVSSGSSSGLSSGSSSGLSTNQYNIGSIMLGF